MAGKGFRYHQIECGLSVVLELGVAAVSVAAVSLGTRHKFTFVGPTPDLPNETSGGPNNSCQQLILHIRNYSER